MVPLNVTLFATPSKKTDFEFRPIPLQTNKLSVLNKFNNTILYNLNIRMYITTSDVVTMKHV